MMRAETEQKIAEFTLKAAAAFTMLALGFIIVFITVKGFPAVSVAFLFENPTDMGRTGGIFSSVVGTIFLSLLSIVIATPLGVGTAV